MFEQRLEGHNSRSSGKWTYVSRQTDVGNAGIADIGFNIAKGRLAARFGPSRELRTDRAHAATTPLTI